MKLIDHMRAHGISDEQMKDAIGGCSIAAVRKWKAGERIPRPDVMARIVEATNGAVTPNDFFPPAVSQLAAAEGAAA